MVVEQEPTAGLTRTGQRRVLAVLCVTEITSWGVLYYAFPVLAPAIATDTGWPMSTLTAAFSGGLVVSALVGIPLGRLLDRRGPRWPMTAGSVLAVPALVTVALAPSFPVFLTGWLVAGVAMSAVLYPPAFAALTRWWGEDRVRALTAVTLCGGLASTVFAPLGAALLGATDWHHTYLVLAGILAVVTVPAHLFGLRGPWPDAPAPAEIIRDEGITPILRSRPFVLLAVAVGLGAFTSFAVPVNQVPLLLGRGLTTSGAAWALGLGGVGQVLGRLAFAPLAGRLGPRGRLAVILALLGATTVVLAVLPGPPALLVGVTVLVGVARGATTLLQATVLAERWPARLYGRLGGVLSAPVMAGTAISPWAGSALAVLLGGYPALFVLLGIVAALGATCAPGTMPRISAGGTAGAAPASSAPTPRSDRE